MAIVIPSLVMDRLAELAAPLLAQAMEDAQAFTYVAEDANEVERAQAEMVQGLVFAIQAALSRLPFNELGVVTAMGAVSGTVMANCATDRRELYRIFQAQMAATLKDVGAAREPMGSA